MQLELENTAHRTTVTLYSTEPSTTPHAVLVAFKLVFSTESARLPFLTVNPILLPFFEPALRQSLSQLDAQTGVTDRLRKALLEALPADEASMKGLGRELGLSPRTLQCKLRKEGTGSGHRLRRPACAQ